MTDLVKVDTALEEAPNLSAAVTQVERLITESQSDALTEARRRAEAHALYERRRGHRSRERHFATLRLLTEAGLGVLSYDDSSLISGSNLRGTFRALACAFERRKLLDICSSCDRLDSSVVAFRIRQLGLSYVPGRALGVSGSVPWKRARVLAVDRGIALELLPADPAAVRAVAQKIYEQTARMQKLYRAVDRLERVKRQKLIANAAKSHSNDLAIAYGLLRRAMQALTDAQTSMDRDERADLGRVLSPLYDAEDELGTLLRVPGGQIERMRNFPHA